MPLLFSSYFLGVLFAANDASAGFQQQEERLPVQRGFQIFECTRSIRSFVTQQMGMTQTGPVHCFVAFAQDGRRIDSRGFFADAGSVQEPDIVDGFVKCRTVKTIPENLDVQAFQDWGKIVKVYDKHRSDMYRLTHTNCCSVATEALRQILDGKEVLDVEKANCYVGTKIKS